MIAKAHPSRQVHPSDASVTLFCRNDQRGTLLVLSIQRTELVSTKSHLSELKREQNTLSLPPGGKERSEQNNFHARTSINVFPQAEGDF